jgi:hypothetical protein
MKPALDTPPVTSGQFFDNRDLVLALGSQLVICGASAAITWWLADRYAFTLFSVVATFWVLMMLAALAFLKALRTLFPILPGTYAYSPRARTTYVWTLHSFICATNLGILYNHPSLMPSLIKKAFYHLLGARLGRGHMMIGGQLTEPYLITIESGAVIGGDCWLLAHAMTRSEGRNVLILQPITIRRDAIIGAWSMIMPGVTVEPGALLRASSYVSMNTLIPAHEQWGGNPAKRRDPARPRLPPTDGA